MNVICPKADKTTRRRHLQAGRTIFQRLSVWVRATKGSVPGEGDNGEQKILMLTSKELLRQPDNRLN
jgi:hypothetical protein